MPTGRQMPKLLWAFIPLSKSSLPTHIADLYLRPVSTSEQIVLPTNYFLGFKV